MSKYRTPAGTQLFTAAQVTKAMRMTAQELIEQEVAKKLAPLKAQATNFMGPMLAAPAVHTDTETKSPAFVTILRSLYEAGGDPDRTMQLCRNKMGEAEASKALAAGDLTAGGIMIHGSVASDVIDLLRAKSVVRRSNPRFIRVPTGTTTFPTLDTSTSAAYVAENTDITASDAVFSGKVLQVRKLAALTTLSRELLKFTNDSADNIVQSDMVKSLAQTEDLYFLRGDGTQNTPKGLLYSTAASNKTATNGTSSTQIEADFKDLIQDLEGNDVPMDNPVWFMNPRSKNHLFTLRDANGNLVFPEIRKPQPTIHGYPVLSTTNIPVNLGGSTQTEIYMVDASEIIIGEVEGIEISMSDTAAYVDSAGTMRAAFSRDQVVIRTILHHDILLRHDVSCAIKTAVAWGA